MGDGGGVEVRWRAHEFLRATRKVLQEACQSSALDPVILEWIPREEDLYAPPEVCVVGTFKAGKSSLINALVGADLSPTDPRPASVRPTRFRGGAVQIVRLLSKSGAYRECTLAHYQRLVNKATHGDLTPAERAELADVELAEIEYPSAALGRINLMDTPGFDDGKGDVDDDATERYLADAVAAVWVFDIEKGDLTDLELQRIRRFGGARRMRFAVLTKADLKAPSARAEVRRAFQRLGVFDEVFVFSANYRNKVNSGTVLSSGLVAELNQNLESALLEQTQSRAGELQARRIAEECDALLKLAMAEVLGARAGFELTAAKYQEELMKLRKAVDDCGRRLSARASAEMKRGCAQIARRRAEELAATITLSGVFSTNAECDPDAANAVFSGVIDDFDRVEARLIALVVEAQESLVEPMKLAQQRVVKTMEKHKVPIGMAGQADNGNQLDMMGFLGLRMAVSSVSSAIQGVAVGALRMFNAVGENVLIAYKIRGREQRREWFEDWLAFNWAAALLDDRLLFDSSEEASSAAQRLLRAAAEIDLSSCGGADAGELAQAATDALAALGKVLSQHEPHFR